MYWHWHKVTFNGRSECDTTEFVLLSNNYLIWDRRLTFACCTWFYFASNHKTCPCIIYTYITYYLKAAIYKDLIDLCIRPSVWWSDKQVTLATKQLPNISLWTCYMCYYSPSRWIMLNYYFLFRYYGTKELPDGFGQTHGCQVVLRFG